MQKIKNFLADTGLRLRTRFSPFPLLTIIEDSIRREGPMSLDRYMEIALQHPRYGYYRHGIPIGDGGDFHTAPEISPLFGEMIGAWCAEAWRSMGRPASFTLLELGPGRGTLTLDLIRHCAQEPGFHQAAKISLFESNATLRELQRERLAAFMPVHIEDFTALEDAPLLVIANEFFDNMPTQQFVRTRSGWAERAIDWQGGRLVFAEKEIGDAAIERMIDAHMPDAEAGAVYEHSRPSYEIVEKICARLMRHGGAALIIDYGHAAPDGKTTLAAWSRHMYTHVLASPGNTDVTAGVDFAALRRIAAASGVAVSDLTTQGDFLAALGLHARADALSHEASPEEKDKIAGVLHKLTSPEAMGSLWKALILSRRES